MESAARDHPGFRWYAQATLHLTLRFLGEIAEEVAGAVAEALDGVPGVPFELRPGAIGSFAGGRGPRVIWASVEGDLDSLRRLAAGVEAACVGCGVPPERRSFRPHLTLARARRREAPVPPLAPPPAPTAWVVDRFALYRSVLAPGGAVHTPIRTFRL